MPPDSGVTVVSLYPQLLGTYGDGGNCEVLVDRARRRGLSARLVTVDPGAPVPVSADVYCLGGGEDQNQLLAAGYLLADPGLGTAVERGAAVLGVCAGLQLLGRSFADDRAGAHPGLGLLDVVCGRLRRRAVGEVVGDAVGVPGLPALTGFENHRGDATLSGSAVPLARLRTGTGNGGSRAEGAVAGRVVGTYLHGPVLARNPALADHLLQLVTGPLPALHDDDVDRLRDERISAAAREDRDGWRRRFRARPGVAPVPATAPDAAGPPGPAGPDRTGRPAAGVPEVRA